jgi:hypothetical protein
VITFPEGAADGISVGNCISRSPKRSGQQIEIWAYGRTLYRRNYVRKYAAINAEDVEGMVLLDSALEEQFSRVSAL